MNRIHLLNEQVANQIAAGEVVERPFNVVKELVENAIDAQATHIKVEIAAGGRSLIRVTDDGIGMNRDDALMSLERHATSKLQKAEELFSISTMGFRGEALPSIASVSRFSLTTRERDGDSPEGTQIIVQGGKITQVQAAGCPTGTQIEARNLFFNIPARKKFMRTAATENGHVQNYLTLAAVAYPEVGWTFIRDGREVWRLPAAGSSISTENGNQTDDAQHWNSWSPDQLDQLRERLTDLFGDEAEKLVPIHAEGMIRPPAWMNRRALPGTLVEDEDQDEESVPLEPTPFRIWGFIGAPGVSRSNRNDMRLFVNRRPVEHRGLNHSIIEGYHNALMKGRFPMTCLFLQLDPSQVDVNVHPAKKEVRFHQDREIRAELSRAIKQALTGFHTGSRPFSETARPEQNLNSPRQREPEAIPQELWSQPITPLFHRPDSSHAAPDAESDPAANQKQPDLPSDSEAGTKPKPSSSPEPLPESSRSSDSRRTLNVANWQAPAPSPLAPETDFNNQTVSDMGFDAAPVSSKLPKSLPSSGPSPLLATPMKLVGVVGRLYVILETDRGMALMDQHAAHERVLFEKTMRQVDQGPVPSQRLLIPETIEMSPKDAHETREWLPMMNQLGIELREFGDRVFALDSIPAFVKHSDPKTFLLDVIDSLKRSDNWISNARLGEDVLTKYVCRMAVKANDNLSPAELERLLEDLKHCEMPYTCPHGRPTIIEMSFSELEKRFGRSV